MYPDLEQYEQLTAEYSVVPVYLEVLADTDTPVSVLHRFADDENVFLLESMEGGETWGRYSFIGVRPELMLESDHSGGPTGILEGLRSVYRDESVAPVKGLPRFCGGAVGFVGYEGMCEFERMPLPREGESTGALSSKFLQANRIIVFDNKRHTVKIVVCTSPKDFENAQAAYAAAAEQIAEIEKILRAPAPLSTPGNYPPIEFESNMPREQYCESVRRAKEYIQAGDIIQVVLSQKFSAESSMPAFQVYRALRLLNPSPYTFFLKVGAQTLVGSSPEVMVRLTGDLVEVRPIAGTRPRGQTEQEDRKLADDLLSDEKEKAEHVMLVDLGRNDIGRVAKAGSVQVREYMTIERYSHVMHLVSHVQGILRDECDAYDVIKACFPAGTLTGAPKIRAMEIIHELEPSPRGVYGGALGYIGYNGNLDLAITIRTLEIQGHKIAVQAGAGIVFDSDPDTEFDETCHKARGMQKAVTMAANALEVEAIEFE